MGFFVLQPLKVLISVQVYHGRHQPFVVFLLQIRVLTVDPVTLLTDLRLNKGIDTALGLPNGPNAGVTLRLM